MANIFVSSLISKRNQTMLIYTMTLENVCKITQRFWLEWKSNSNSYIFYSTRCIHLSQLATIPFQLNFIINYSNIFKCVNLIEIQFLYAYFYTPPFLVFWHIMFDTTNRYWKLNLGENMDIWRQISILTLRTNNQLFWLLLDIITCKSIVTKYVIIISYNKHQHY